MAVIKCQNAIGGYIMTKMSVPDPLKKYYIAYMDVLGYKAFFDEHPDRVGEFLNDISNMVQGSYQYVEQVAAFGAVANVDATIQIRAFSDNILFCMPVGNEKNEIVRFLAFVATISDIQRSLINQHKIYVRGGITVGELSMNEHFVFGKGLIDVVNMESSAIYPRLVMSQSIVDILTTVHLITKEDVDRGAQIEQHLQKNEQVSEEDRQFYDSLRPMIPMISLLLDWQCSLCFHCFDGKMMLNYMIPFQIQKYIQQPTIDMILQMLKKLAPEMYNDQMIPPPNQAWDLISIHKQRLEQSIVEYGKYTDIGDDQEQKAKQREHVLKKYLWLMMYHNAMCIKNHFEDLMIKSGSTMEPRFLCLEVSVFPNDMQNVLEAKTETVNRS